MIMRNEGKNVAHTHGEKLAMVSALPRPLRFCEGFSPAVAHRWSGKLLRGVIQAAAPLGFWWLDAATVYGTSIALIAAVYIGFAVADGRPAVTPVEPTVAVGFRWYLLLQESPGRRG